MSLTLTPEELHALTGYRRPADQLRALHQRGYWRAVRLVTGQVCLTLAHLEAVERGQDGKPQGHTGPRLRAAA